MRQHLRSIYMSIVEQRVSTWRLHRSEIEIFRSFFLCLSFRQFNDDDERGEWRGEAEWSNLLLLYFFGWNLRLELASDNNYLKMLLLSFASMRAIVVSHQRSTENIVAGGGGQLIHDANRFTINFDSLFIVLDISIWWEFSLSFVLRLGLTHFHLAVRILVDGRFMATERVERKITD